MLVWERSRDFGDEMPAMRCVADARHHHDDARHHDHGMMRGCAQGPDVSMPWVGTGCNIQPLHINHGSMISLDAAHRAMTRGCAQRPGVSAPEKRDVSRSRTRKTGSHGFPPATRANPTPIPMPSHPVGSASRDPKAFPTPTRAVQHQSQLYKTDSTHRADGQQGRPRPRLGPVSRKRTTRTGARIPP